jgi:hypothetical protein
VNKMMKGSDFMTHVTSLNTFVRKLLQVIQHINHNSAGETHWSHVHAVKVDEEPWIGGRRRTRKCECKVGGG